jgi:hypothetical protein
MSNDILAKLGPYINRVVRTLALMLPIAGAVVGALPSDASYVNLREDIELTKAIVDALPGSAKALDTDVGAVERLTHSEGAGLRALRALLFEQDPTHLFGGLRRRQTAAGDFVWICQAHYPEYDPGLPELPLQ